MQSARRSPGAAGPESETGRIRYEARPRAAAFDALAWLLSFGVGLALIHIGRLSGDGLVQTQEYQTRSWTLNPNHLLYEPTGAAWLHLMGRLGLHRPPVDQMTLLSVGAGAITIAIFRRFVAQRAPSRTAANLATAWVAFFAAFISLWLSSEVQMIQMPWLAGSFAAALWYADRPSCRRAALAGALIGVATVFYVSNILLAAAVPLALAAGARPARRRYPVVELATLLGSAVAVTLTVFVSAWLLNSGASRSFLSWLLSYGGGHGSARIAATYGVHGVAEAPVALARAVYGTAMGLVDISGVVADLRMRGTITAASIAALATCAVALITVAYAVARGGSARRRDWPALLVSTGWLTAVFAFGVYWNNSDDQFYFQMSLAFGALVATNWTERTRAPLAVATVLLAAWNGGVAWRDLVRYPRDEYVAGLAAATQGARLVVFPGSDEIMELMYFVPRDSTERRINLTSVAGTVPAAVGLPDVTHAIDCALAAGGRVVVLDVAVPGSGRDSWRALALLGYPRDRVVRLFNQYGLAERRRVGPFVADRVARAPNTPSPNCLRTSPGG